MNAAAAVAQDAAPEQCRAVHKEATFARSRPRDSVTDTDQTMELLLIVSTTVVCKHARKDCYYMEHILAVVVAVKACVCSKLEARGLKRSSD